MGDYSREKLKENYEVDFHSISKEIGKNGAKRVLFQFPDGLKPYATAVVDYFELEFKEVDFFIYFGSCFGACDVPVDLEGLDIDLVFQIGHNSMMPCYLK